MKQFWLVATAALLVTTLLPDGAFAQRGGFRGGAIGGGFRGAAIGGGFRGVGPGIARVGPGFRAAAIGGGFRGVGPGIARVGPGFPSAAIGPGFRGARVAAFRGAGWAPGWRWRRGWGWPLAFGLGLGAAWDYPYDTSYYSDPCIFWEDCHPVLD